MATQTFFTMEACLQQATERRTAYAAGTINLFRETLIPDPTTLKAAFVAAVATYTTYAPAAVANFNTPILAETSGYLIASPTVQFNTGVADPGTTNLIGGAVYYDTAGKVRIVTKFDPPVPMQIANQGFEFAFVDVFPTGF